MPKITHLPHVRNVKSGINRYDPNHAAVFEVYFTLPPAIQSQFAEDEALLTEQVTEVAGLDTLQKLPGVGSQKFMGVDVSFQNPAYDSTYHEVTITFNLNLRNVTDNFVFKIFKAWSKLNYDLEDGTRTLKADYVADNLRIAEANRDGTIWRAYVYHDVLLVSVTGLDTLNYTDNEPRKLVCQFRADVATEDVA